MSDPTTWGYLLSNLCVVSNDYDSGEVLDGCSSTNPLPANTDMPKADNAEEGHDLHQTGRESQNRALDAVASGGKPGPTGPRVAQPCSVFFRSALNMMKMEASGLDKTDCDDDDTTEIEDASARELVLALRDVPDCEGGNEVLEDVGSGDKALQQMVGETSRLLELAQQVPGQYDLIQDAEARAVARYWLVEKSRLSSLTAEAVALKTTEYRVKISKHRCAMAAIVFERRALVDAMQSIAKDVVKQGGELVAFYWLARYDETPMKFRIPDTTTNRLVSEGGNQFEKSGLTGLRAFELQDALPQKILHSQAGTAMLVRIGEVHFSFHFPLLCWLQALDRTQHSCYFRALQSIEMQCSQLAATFNTQHRLVCTDGDGAVAKAEIMTEIACCSLAFAEKAICSISNF
jgi:hypothetical protein